MRTLDFPRFMAGSALALLLSLAPASSQQTSTLWGSDGALWDPATSRLGDFTSVGYMSGGVAIPDWPVGANVTTFGAIPNDGLDDSQAFIDAIAACPDNHAVLVPNGRYTILQQIVPNRDHFVLRGEDMYQTVLHFPKYLNEIYIQEVGHENPAYDDGSNGYRHTGVPKGFFRISGGTERSIENLSFEFREQRKMGHWEHKGASAIYYGGDVTDSWVRNIYIKNGDNAVMTGRSYRISFLNIIFDHYIGRPDIIGSGSTQRWVGHIGMSMSNAQHCLFHNIDFRGNYFHEFDNINVPKNCVVSNITGTDVSLHHHGGGARFNLYTNASVGTGPGINGLGTTQDAETHWRIFGDETLDAPTDAANLANNHVFVGYDSTQAELIDASTWYEVIGPAQLQPQNIYLAQLAHPSINKPLPESPPPAPPSPFTGDVIRISPIEDSSTDASNPDTVQDPSAKNLTVGDNMYLKFDLNGVSLNSIAKVRLRVSSTRFQNTPVGLAVFSIDDDSWSDDTLTDNGRPPSVTQLDAIGINEDSLAQVLEFDVTPFVQAEWSADKVVSLVIERVSGSGAVSGIRSMEAGLAPELIIEQVASAVPGAPSAPARVKSFSLIGNVQLDWSHDSEGSANFTFTVYRSLTAGGPYSEVVSGLTASAHTDSGLSNGTTYHYVVTASNSSGESPPTGEVSATPVAGLSVVTNYLDGLLSDPTSWDAGLPVGQWGRVNLDATFDSSVELDGYSVLHTGGTLIKSGIGTFQLTNGTTWITEGPDASTETGFRGFNVSGGSSLTLRQGTFNTAAGRDWRASGAGSVITADGGTINLGRHLLLSSNGGFTINGGVINGNPGSGDMGVRNFASGGTFDFNGGITTIHRLDLGGANTTFNFGGSVTGSLTATAFNGSFGSNSTLNFLPGSLMSLTVTGEDEWAAAKWAAGDLTYNGQGVAALGSWAAVTAPDGLGPGVSFAYDSATETLALSDPDGDGDKIDDAWEILNFGSTEAVDGSLDSDGDGVLDFFEYLYGSDPNDAGSDGFRLQAGPAPSETGPVFDWETREAFALGTDYQAEFSTNLGSWNPLPEAHYSLQNTPNNGLTRRELFLTHDYGAQFFLRLGKP